MDAGRTTRRKWLRYGLCLGFAVALLGGCKCEKPEDKADNKPDFSFCEDQALWIRWEGIVEQFRWDDTMMELYALRLGLCSMMYTGQIEPERGVRMFEKASHAWEERFVASLQQMERMHAAQVKAEQEAKKAQEAKAAPEKPKPPPPQKEKSL